MIIGISGYSGVGKDTIGAIIQYIQSPNIGNITIEDVCKDYKKYEPILEEQSKWKIKKFAYKLKQVVSIITGIPIEKLENQEYKKTNLDDSWGYWTIETKDNGKVLFYHGRYETREAASKFLPFLKEIYGVFRMEYNLVFKQMSVRALLQEIGTDALRQNIHPNVWVNALLQEYKKIEYSGDDEQGTYPNWIITDCRFQNEALAIKEKGGVIVRITKPGLKPINNHVSEIDLDNWEHDFEIVNDSDIPSLVNKIKDLILKLKTC